MAYRQDQTIGQFLDSTDTKAKDSPLAQPMTYSDCPECGKPLISCNCENSNYYCICGWKHVNHHHTSNKRKDVYHI